MDKRWIEKGFSRQSERYASVSQVQMQMSRHLCSLLNHTRMPMPRTILEFGAGTGNLTLALQEHLKAHHPQWLILDISRSMLEHHQKAFQPTKVFQPTAESGDYKYIQADIENWPWPSPDSAQSPDLLTSNATLQWLEDLPGLFRRFAQSMKPGSYGLIGTFGPQTLVELHQSYFAATGHRLESEAQFVSVKDLQDIVTDSGFEFLVADTRDFLQHHQDTADLLHTLKQMGVTRTSRTRALNRQSYRKLTEYYQQQFSSEHGVYCTWQGVFVLFKKT